MGHLRLMFCHPVCGGKLVQEPIQSIIAVWILVVEYQLVAKTAFKNLWG
jgi:hypothetical protein